MVATLEYGQRRDVLRYLVLTKNRISVMFDSFSKMVLRNYYRDMLWAEKDESPLCKRRILDIVTPTKECVIVRLKCPHCNVVVKVEIFLFVKDNIK